MKFKISVAVNVVLILALIAVVVNAKLSEIDSVVVGHYYAQKVSYIARRSIAEIDHGNTELVKTALAEIKGYASYPAIDLACKRMEQAPWPTQPPAPTR